jgi:hypothetical protein
MPHNIQYLPLIKSRGDQTVAALIVRAGGDPKKFNHEEFSRGYTVEKEHKAVTKGNPVLTAKIVLDHLREVPDYYTKLVKVEHEGLQKSHVKAHTMKTKSGRTVMVRAHDDKRTKRQEEERAQRTKKPDDPNVNRLKRQGEDHSNQRQKDMASTDESKKIQQASRSQAQVMELAEESKSGEEFEKGLRPGMGVKTVDQMIAHLDETGAGHMSFEEARKKLEAGGQYYMRLNLSVPSLQKLKGLDKGDIPDDYDNDEPITIVKGEVVDGKHRAMAAVRDGRRLSAYLPAKEWWDKMQDIGKDEPQEEKTEAGEGGSEGLNKEAASEAKKQSAEGGDDGGSKLPARLLNKIKRRGKGEGEETQFTRAEVDLLLADGVVGIVSAGKNPKLEKEMTKEQEKKRHEELRSDLKDKGLMHMQVVGMYEGLEDSFMVFTPEVKREELVEMGEKYNQDSVIFTNKGKNEMIFTTGDDKGKHHPGEGFKARGNNAKDYYTEYVTEDGKKRRFQLQFEWGELKKGLRVFMESLRKSHVKAHMRKTKSGKVVAVRDHTNSRTKKTYREHSNIGAAKHVISFHDGKKKHEDGSDFYDIKIFRSQKEKQTFVRELDGQGYTNHDNAVQKKAKPAQKKGSIPGKDEMSNTYEGPYHDTFDGKPTVMYRVKAGGHTWNLKDHPEKVYADKVQEYTQLLADLKAKKITPRRVAGGGATMKSAREWVEKTKAQAESYLAEVKKKKMPVYSGKAPAVKAAPVQKKVPVKRISKNEEDHLFGKDRVTNKPVKGEIELDLHKKGKQKVAADIYGPVAVHKNIEGKGYVVTHVKTGLSIRRGISSKAKAVAAIHAARELGIHYNFTTVAEAGKDMANMSKMKQHYDTLTKSQSVPRLIRNASGRMVAIK